jgi:myo-inositol 2-dehydrogenase / D-chiro-inositol 1-dehydrogenase
MSTPVRIGLLGCGSVACNHHLPALRRMPGAVVVAVADPDPTARARAAGLAPGAEVHADAEELLGSSDVDAVVVAAPTKLHADLAAAAARAGKHVYVEKPLATDEGEARRVLEEVARSGVTAAVGFNRRRHPVYEQARKLLEAGRIGDVRFVQTAFCEPVDPHGLPEWKRTRATGGGVLLDLASHHFDLARWFLHAEIEVVQARTHSGRSEQEEAWTEISTSTGVEVQSLFSFRAAYADFIEFFGELGRLRVDRHGGALVMHRPRRSGYGIRRVWSPSAASQARRVVGLGGDPSYARALGAFVQRLGGVDVETPSLEDGLRSLQAVLAAERLATG